MNNKKYYLLGEHRMTMADLCIYVHDVPMDGQGQASQAIISIMQQGAKVIGVTQI